MPSPLQPIINSAKVKIAVADAPAFMAGLFSLTPLPANKTADQCTAYQVRKNNDGSLLVTTNFKS